MVVNSSEGHVYTGPLENGHWVDASNLKVGDRLLNHDESWSEVVSVEQVTEPLKAYNLTVEDFHTYFIAGLAAANDNLTLAKAVWVHNDCFEVDKLRAEPNYYKGKRHGIAWTDADAIKRAIDTGNPQGRFGSKEEIDYVVSQIKNLGAETGRVTVGEKPPIKLPSGHNSVVFYPDGSSKPATHVWVRVNPRGRGTVHMYPMVKE